MSTYNKTMNEDAISNLNKIKYSYLFLPLLLLAIIAISLYACGAWSADHYVSIQKEAFTYCNLQLSQFPVLMYNLIQFGDALVILSLCTFLIIYAPRIWESLIWASLVSALLCCPFKWLFKIPRPAAILDNGSFVIIGKAYVGNNSLPSGHAITAFTVLTVLLWAFMPKNSVRKIIWIVLMIGIGSLISLSRVGIGAHHLLDVVIGSIIGYISGISGILINRNFMIWSWIADKEYHPLFIIIFTICSVIIMRKMLLDHQPVFYLSLLSLFITTYIITVNYVKK
ncbi:phosphatase PAP2 family protein [uncultured Chryseobacterium sp.]|uniref:phosphatase PAP2 family protein n=1 Tax=uncultured Chryseobacterium sp. TaxID=259322 RepID=UPI0025D0814C|nr:phosphatase PAP2 family protein [uncultured Chryseobacterium sp.]